MPSAARARVIPCVQTSLTYRGRPLVMGVLNVTPDSFSDGGWYLDAEAAIRRGLELVEEGADLIDIGGESTRPGSQRISSEDERRRVLPVIAPLARRIRVPISIDPSKAEVAAKELEAGASIVNDVTSLGDPAMARVVASHRAAVILMHRQGTPETMQQQPVYDDVVAEVRATLRQSAQRAEAAGIARAQILLDPGIGFGKTTAHNLQLLRALDQFVALGYPVVVGASRKSLISRSLGGTIAVERRLGGSLACVAHAQRCGVHLVRVHDVEATVQYLRMFDAIAHSELGHR